MDRQLTGKLCDTNGSMNAGFGSPVVQKDITKFIQYNSIYEFPNRGDLGILYVDSRENATYRWDETASKYYCVGRDYQEIDRISGGIINE